jgi:membrane-associated PAP2 superfamily phosphatase
MASLSVTFRFWLLNLGLPLFAALATFAVFDLTDLDLAISNLLWDPAAGQFPLEHNHLFERITHKWARILPDWVGEGAIIGVALSFVWPLLARFPDSLIIRCVQQLGLEGLLTFAQRHRRDSLFVVAAFAASTGAIHYLKSHTSVYCPVETVLYGGVQARMEWFENFRFWSSPGAGRCWPGGHASSAFSLLALHFVARRYQWRYAPTVLHLTGLLGLLYGTTRVLQGWHYMSHTLWAGIVVWLSTLAIALLFYGRVRLQQPLRTTRPVTALDEPLHDLR